MVIAIQRRRFRVREKLNPSKHSMGGIVLLRLTSDRVREAYSCILIPSKNERGASIPLEVSRQFQSNSNLVPR